jgi:hypothetical protein
MNSRMRSVIAALGLFLGTAVGHAAPLGLTSKSPDVTSAFVKVVYTASTDTFTAIGSSATFDVNGIAPPDYNISAGGSPSEQFAINMTVNPANGALSSGTITITGKINTAKVDAAAPNVSATSGTLLTGNLTNFGFPTAGGTVFEFIFTVTGGDLASFYGGNGATAGSIVNEQSGETGNIPFTGSFTSNFQNTSNSFSLNGVSDTFVVPEPMSLGMAILSLLGLLPVRVRVPRR